MTGQTTSDEIDLIEIWRTLVKGKWVIFSSIAICLLIAAIYLGITPKEYKATAYLLPPDVSGVVGLEELERLEESKAVDSLNTVEQVYLKLVSQLNSRSLKKDFFEKENIVSLFTKNSEDMEASFINKFLPAISVKQGSNKKADDMLSQVEVSLQLPTTSQHVADLTNGYVRMAITHTKEALINDFLSQKRSHIQSLEPQASV